MTLAFPAAFGARFRPLLALLLALGWGACASGSERRDETASRATDLAAVRRWAVQLQGAAEPFAAKRLEAARVDMLVIDAMRSQRGMEHVPVRDLVHRLRSSQGASSPRKVCLAYLNVGQAEDYRSYWQSDWRAPTSSAPGTPAFMVSVDPDGWPGNYPVTYWDPRWKRVLFGHRGALLDQILEDGFDGVYLDWVLGYQEPAVARVAREAGVDPAAEMVQLIAELREYARTRRADFVIVPQNAVDLAAHHPRLFELIDGLAQEDLSFSGRADAKWDEPGAGDVAAPAEGPWSTDELAARLTRFSERGIPVFTLDYARQPENARRAMVTSRRYGFVPFVSRTPLDRLPTRVLAAPGSAPR